MTVESPFLGKGFKAFQYFKGRYTSVDVHESDTHNMFLFVSSQMGIPALISFLATLACLFGFGYAVWRKAGDGFARSLGLAGIGMSGAVVVINMFGSRMVNIEVCAYVWVFLAVLGHLFAELQVPTARKVRAGRNETAGATNTELEIAPSTTVETTLSVRKATKRQSSGLSLIHISEPTRPY